MDVVGVDGWVSNPAVWSYGLAAVAFLGFALQLGARWRGAARVADAVPRGCRVRRLVCRDASASQSAAAERCGCCPALQTWRAMPHLPRSWRTSSGTGRPSSGAGGVAATLDHSRSCGCALRRAARRVVVGARYLAAIDTSAARSCVRRVAGAADRRPGRYRADLPAHRSHFALARAPAMPGADLRLRLRPGVVFDRKPVPRNRRQSVGGARRGPCVLDSVAWCGGGAEQGLDLRCRRVPRRSHEHGVVVSRRRLSHCGRECRLRAAFHWRHLGGSAPGRARFGRVAAPHAGPAVGNVPLPRAGLHREALLQLSLRLPRRVAALYPDAGGARQRRVVAAALRARAGGPGREQRRSALDVAT